MEFLKFGSSGPYVYMLQLALSRCGYLDSSPDGVFGLEVQSAVIAFQRGNRLTADGTVGERTWSSLSPYLLGYILITARRGDSFTKLSKKYKTEYEAILQANPNMSPINLRIGSRVIIPLGFPVIPTTIPFCSALLDICIKGLKMRYPFIQTGSIGESTAGKQIHFLKLGSGDKKVFYNGAHHANEWITTPILLKFFEDYAKAVSVGGKIGFYDACTLINRTTLFIVPMVNPDGVDLVTGAMPKSSPLFENALAIAAEYPDIPFPEGWKANISGIDLNLQYPAGWYKAREIKKKLGFYGPAPKNYVGPAPLFAPESAAVCRFAEENDFRLTLSYHTQGGEIYWKYLNLEPPSAHEIVLHFCKASGYVPADVPEESSYAGFKDWFIEHKNRPSFTIEAGRGESPLPLSMFDEIYNDNIGILSSGLNLT